MDNHLQLACSPRDSSLFQQLLSSLPPSRRSYPAAIISSSSSSSSSSSFLLFILNIPPVPAFFSPYKQRNLDVYVC